MDTAIHEPDEPRWARFLPWITPLAGLLWWLLFQDHATFPVGDGGLFHAFIQGVAAHGPAPLAITYNSEQIPFTYPPLPFWLYGGLTWLGCDALALLRWGPLLTTLLCLGLATRIIQRLGAGTAATLIAATLLVMLPRSWEWMIQGGGMTRSLGYAFTLATILLSLSARERWDWRTLVACGLCCGGAVLSHPEWAICAAASVVIVAGSQRNLKHSIRTVAVIGGLAAVIALPWYGWMLERHSIGPFLAAHASGTQDGGLMKALNDMLAPPSLRDALPLPSGLFSLSKPAWPLAVFVVIGVITAGIERSRLLLLVPLAFAWAWLTPRHALTPLVLPVAGLAAVGCWSVLAPGLAAMVDRIGHGWAAHRDELHRHRLTVAVLCILCGWGWYWSRAWVLDIQPMTSARPLSADLRAGYAWAQRELPPQAVIAVVSDTWGWAYDAPAEWAPELTRRRCLPIVQGSEWLPGDAFQERIEEQHSVAGWACSADRSCQRNRLPTAMRSATHVLFCQHARRELLSVDQLVLEQPDAQRLASGDGWALYQLPP
jgi:hypothetical protein